MSSLIYNHAIASGTIDFAKDTFKAMLVTSAYQPDKDNHVYRGDVQQKSQPCRYTAAGLS